MTTETRLLCDWCKTQNDVGAISCQTCGAPLDVTNVVTEGGWRAAPRVRDSTKFSFGSSSVELEGEIVPAITVELGSGDMVYFHHRSLLWKDEGTPLGILDLSGSAGGGFLRKMVSAVGGTNRFATATGPGNVAFSRDAAGELVVLPVATGQEMDVREHTFLVGSHTLKYHYESLSGVSSHHGGGTMGVDRFNAEGADGLVMLHGNGNVFQRDLKAGESIYIEPGAFLYKDKDVTLEGYSPDLKMSKIGGRINLVKVTGPGRVGIQSMGFGHSSEDE